MNPNVRIDVLFGACKFYDYFHHKGLGRIKELVSIQKVEEKEILNIFECPIMMVYSQIHIICMPNTANQLALC